MRTLPWTALLLTLVASAAGAQLPDAPPSDSEDPPEVSEADALDPPATDAPATEAATEDEPPPAAPSAQAVDDERPPSSTPERAPEPDEDSPEERVEDDPHESTHWTDKVRFGGLMNLWASTRQGGALPEPRTLPFGVRTARLSASADPHEWVRIGLQLGLEAPTNPLLDATVELRPPSVPVRVTAGQFRIPVGATTITPYGALVFWDRPLHVGRYLKLAIRDIGLKVHAPNDFPIRYQFGVFNGTGILGAGGGPLAPVPRNLLYTGRVTVDAAHWLDALDRFEFGASYATSRHETGFGPANTLLGTNLGFVNGDHRVHVFSTDLSIAVHGAWFQFESWYLRAKNDEDAFFPEEAESLAFSMEFAYRFGEPDFYVQPAVRYEFFQPSRPEGMSDFQTDHLFTVGVNVRVVEPLLFGAYYIWYDPQGMDNTVHQVRFRLQAGF